jgi:hypothetical protein
MIGRHLCFQCKQFSRFNVPIFENTVKLYNVSFGTIHTTAFILGLSDRQVGGVKSQLLLFVSVTRRIYLQDDS